MAAQSKLFQRLIWLVDTIYSAGHISRNEIDRRWCSARYNGMLYKRTAKEYSIEGLDEANGRGLRS